MRQALWYGFGLVGDVMGVTVVLLDILCYHGVAASLGLWLLGWSPLALHMAVVLLTINLGLESFIAMGPLWQGIDLLMTTVARFGNAVMRRVRAR